MCGIVGYIGERSAGPLLMDCLKRLEYRGFDSAGIGVVQGGRLELRRSAGKIAELERVLGSQPVEGHAGIAHTRWATHGRPSADNAHPHPDCASSVAVVHNGIIENHRPLRRTLEAEGHRFGSETDTEVIPHLIESRGGGIEEATQEAVGELVGDYALGIISRRAPGKLVAVRRGGPPLLVGLAPDGLFLTSDASAILSYTRDVVSLEDGEMAVLSREGVRLETLDGRPVDRPPTRVPWDAATAQRGGFPHFMLKEIWEQPRSIRDTCRGRVDLEAGEVRLPEPGLEAEALARVRRLVLVACGTSWHAALVGKHVLESLCRVPAEVDFASEYRYRPPVTDPETLTIAISQSGETADTLGAVKESRARGSRVVAVSNVLGSTIARESDGVLYTHAGPEIGVASTKAFTSQLVALDLLAIRLARARGTLSPDGARTLLAELAAIPRQIEEMLARAGELLELASTLRSCASVLYLGRGIQYPLALEGALKLKEVSYIHAEGYPAGEMKHGPIALVDRAMPAVVIAPRGRLYEKTLSNIEEIRARDGRVIALVSEDDREVADKADRVFRLPRTSELLLPILSAVPLQLLAYHAAVLRGCDVDQPRNLAKSVTVE
ncbi:MAG TPA: glutamine--fructose-6-phosphate transaminase (isomerizing) [Vicinamibacteria bacterium]|nr:glutamine--fructose-6-phosphate transaminase (isomerizing) [Vicinamibacteria bacterium]